MYFLIDSVFFSASPTPVSTFREQAAPIFAVKFKSVL